MQNAPRVYKTGHNMTWYADKENNFLAEDGSRMGGVFRPAIKLPSGKYISGEYTSKPLSGFVIMRSADTDQFIFEVKEVIEDGIEGRVNRPTVQNLVKDRNPVHARASGE